MVLKINASKFTRGLEPAPLEPNARFLRSGEEPFIFAWGNGSSMASVESVARPDGTIPANRGPQDYVPTIYGQGPGPWCLAWLPNANA